MENQIKQGIELHPTAKEFANFHDYILKIENKYAKDHGLVKIIPPKSWKPRKGSYEDVVTHDYIPQPIEQNAYGKGGIYECLHMVQKSLSMKEYKKRSDPFNNITDGKSVEKIEEMFYKNISFSPPLYGADSRKTLFDDSCKQWNLQSLDCLLKKGLQGIIQGVNDPYLYVGAWKTMFSWHKEDLDLGAINYLHHGKPKFWYAIPNDDYHYLEKMAKLYFADNFNKCPEFMRHKTIVINPYLLKKQFPQIRIQKMVQREREFVIVFPGSYHHGFNYGFNIAEAVNYATTNWLPLFTKAKICKCINDLVKINHREFYDNMVKSDPSLKNDNHVKQFLKFLKDNNLYQKAPLPVKKEEQKPLPITKKIIKKIGKQTKTTPKKQQKQQLQAQQNDDSLEEEDNTLNSTQSSTTIPQPKKQKQLRKKVPLPKQTIKKIVVRKSQRQQQQQKESGKKSESLNAIKARILKSTQTEKTTQKQIQKKKNKDNKMPPIVLSKEEIQKNAMIIEDWLQCDDCKKWRKIDQTLQNLKRRKKFYCEYLTVKCKAPQTEVSFSK